MLCYDVRTNGGILQKNVAFLLKIGYSSRSVLQVAALTAATWWSFVSLCYVNVPLLIGMGECCSPCGITHSLNICRTKCFTENVYEGARFINIRLEGRVTKFVKAIVTRQPTTSDLINEDRNSSLRFIISVSRFTLKFPKFVAAIEMLIRAKDDVN